MNEQLKGFFEEGERGRPLKEELPAPSPACPKRSVPSARQPSPGKPASMCRSRTSLLSKRELDESSTSWQEEVTPVAVGKPVRLMDDRPVLCDCPREGTGA